MEEPTDVDIIIPPRRSKLPESVSDQLKRWLHEHADHPYPSEDEKKILSAATDLTVRQVTIWMQNARQSLRREHKDLMATDISLSDQPRSSAFVDSSDSGNNQVRDGLWNPKMVPPSAVYASVAHRGPVVHRLEGQYDFVDLFERLSVALLKDADALYGHQDSAYQLPSSSQDLLTAEDTPEEDSIDQFLWSRQLVKDRNIEALDWTPFVKLDTDSKNCIGSGGFGDAYIGDWEIWPLSEDPPGIVIKKFRIATTDVKDINRRLKGLFREIAVWHRLKHENVVPFVGVYQTINNTPCLISEYMSNGSVKSFISRNHSVCLIRIIRGVARGLKYLHDSHPAIIHGDMKADNVLINGRGESCICDFGLSRVLIDNTLWNTSATHASGTLRWMSPELLDDNDLVISGIESDIYAYGMTCYEIMRGLVPFHQKRRDNQVLIAVSVRQERPTRDANCITDIIWAMMESCWAHDPEKRLSTSAILKVLEPHDCKTIASSFSCIAPDESWGK